jgi:hypothetical protein
MTRARAEGGPYRSQSGNSGGCSEFCERELPLWRNGNDSGDVRLSQSGNLCSLKQNSRNFRAFHAFCLKLPNSE